MSEPENLAKVKIKLSQGRYLNFTNLKALLISLLLLLLFYYCHYHDFI